MKALEYGEMKLVKGEDNLHTIRRLALPFFIRILNALVFKKLLSCFIVLNLIWEFTRKEKISQHSSSFDFRQTLHRS